MTTPLFSARLQTISTIAAIVPRGSTHFARKDFFKSSSLDDGSELMVKDSNDGSRAYFSVTVCGDTGVFCWATWCGGADFAGVLLVGCRFFIHRRNLGIL